MSIQIAVSAGTDVATTARAMVAAALATGQVVRSKHNGFDLLADPDSCCVNDIVAQYERAAARYGAELKQRQEPA